MSRNRKTAEEAHMRSHFTNSFSIAASTNVATSWVSLPAKSVCLSAPEERRRGIGADHLLAHDAPELAHLGLHLSGFAAQHLEDQAGIVGQPAGTERHAMRQIDTRL